MAAAARPSSGSSDGGGDRPSGDPTHRLKITDRAPGAHASGSPGAGREWADRSVAVAVTGGIACYKAASVVSRLVQDGARVRVLMTEAATRFVAPLTFESLSGNPVVTSVWDAQESRESQHVGLARWCDLLIIAPATADTIARLAAGLAGDPVCLTAAALPRTTPVLLAPAMNAQMWENPVTQRNVATVRDVLGYRLVGPETGWQACRTQGPGRMSEPDAIVDAAGRLVAERPGS